MGVVSFGNGTVVAPNPRELTVCVGNEYSGPPSTADPLSPSSLVSDVLNDVDETDAVNETVTEVGIVIILMAAEAGVGELELK